MLSKNLLYIIFENAIDSYNDTNITSIKVNSSEYILPIITAPIIILNNNIQNYTYVSVNTPFQITETTGSFKVNNTKFYFGNGDNLTVSPQSNQTYQTTLLYTYSISGIYNVSANTTDYNGFSYTNNSIIQVYNYTPPSTKLLITTGFIHNQSYIFSVNPGTFPIKYLVVEWGDGTINQVLSNQLVNNKFILYHTYNIPTTYNVIVKAVNIQNIIENQSLINPALTIYPFYFPTLKSIFPNKPYNGANDLTNKYFFFVNQGSYPIRNITINWGDGYGTVKDAISHLNITGGFNTTHTFPFLQSYKVTTKICDELKDCTIKATPIILGFRLQNATITQNNLNQTLYTLRIEKLKRSQKYNFLSNPTDAIILGILLTTIISIIILSLFKISKRKKR